VDYDEREDRKIRELIRNTAPYDSRKTIKCKYDVTRFVDKFASGLGGHVDDILDKYYTPDHSPTRDVMTEMGDVTSASGPAWWQGLSKSTRIGINITLLAILATVLYRRYGKK